MAAYAMCATVAGEFAAVAERVKAALKAQGFGVLTEIDVQRTLREKLGEEIEPYLIYGACNPTLAFHALSVDREIGLLLPCNVVVRQTAEGVSVSIIDPAMMAQVTDAAVQQQLAPQMAEARQRLHTALQALAAE